MFEIVVINFKPRDGYNQLKGFGDIQLNGVLTIKGIRLLEAPTGFWIAFPQAEYKKDTKTKYVEIIVVSDEIKSSIRDAIVNAYRSIK